MFGSATFVIVESSVCISDAAMTPTTIKNRRSPFSETSPYCALGAGGALATSSCHTHAYPMIRRRSGGLGVKAGGVDPPGDSAIRISGRRAGLRFDAERNVTTEALLFLGDLDREAIGPGLAHATHYEPTPVGEVAELLAHVPFEFAPATFVDLGSGMGRALMEAARLPFRQIVGVEISPALHAVATDNFARLERAGFACRNVRLVRADAASYRFPRGPLVVYLYNPFSGVVLCEVLARLKKGARSCVAILYHTPVERELIEADPAFELIAEASCGAVYVLASARATQRSHLQQPE